MTQLITCVCVSQVTMVERSAAERICKDPNPIIDGRKANVNLAYLGAKPRVQAAEFLGAYRSLFVQIFSNPNIFQCKIIITFRSNRFRFFYSVKVKAKTYNDPINDIDNKYRVWLRYLPKNYV